MSDAASMVFLDPAHKIEIRPLVPGHDDEAAAILGAATGEDTSARGAEHLAELRARHGTELYGLFAHGRLAAVYSLARESMANEVTCLAVREDERRRGYGRACLRDALRRSGKRPLVAETAEDALGFYKACGFKLVGRRKHPSGTVRYRVGWHAPGIRFKGGVDGATRKGTKD